MKKYLLLVAFTLMGIAPIYAQDIKREGNTFVQVKSEKTSVESYTKTKYTFKAKDGKEYPIYLSKNGKAFIIRTSQKTGKEYKQYLPQVTEQLNNEIHEKETK